jgi:hypothetical protein
MLYKNLGEGRCPTVPDEWLGVGFLLLGPSAGHAYLSRPRSHH